MDFSNLKDQVSNLTLYDLKASVRKVQNAVMNFTEMEAKVREATNNEPWGASSTLMQEIANGTFNYQQLNEIMPMIYKRFTEKTAEEWRQIYKALQLLEFLIKNGSERVVDDARSHLSLLKMLREFQFYDQNGKDQGVNVRNRAKELAELLSDVEKIRTERKKARSNRNKFGGVEGGAGFAGGISSGSAGRYGGFGSDDAGFGGYTGRTYGDGGGFGGDTSGFRDTARRNKFEEYDEGDEEPSTSSRRAPPKAKREELKKKAPEVDLFSFGDEDVPTPPPKNPASNGKAAAEDDDFDDFISAPAVPSSSIQQNIPQSFATVAPSTTTFAAPQPVPIASQTAPLQSLATFSPPPQAQVRTSTPGSTFSSPPTLVQPNAQPANQIPPSKPTGYQPSGPNYFTSVPVMGTSSPALSTKSSMTSPQMGSTGAKPAASKGGDAFGNLWSSASAASGIKKTPTPSQGTSLASLAKEKASQGIWNQPSAVKSPQQQFTAQMGGSQGQATKPQVQQQTQPQSSYGDGLDDLLG